jgi:hypothetical protein
MLGLQYTHTNDLWKSELTSRDWKILLSVAPVLSYDEGQVIIANGENNQYWYKIKSGTVRVQKVCTCRHLLSLLPD